MEQFVEDSCLYLFCHYSELLFGMPTKNRIVLSILSKN